ncbi:hypothetical protein PUN28_014678 [Cardiocondyla obscurior]|uniref:Uncharacterized protein n=1 Tax=Cardiocondyla obscurior TaxID=286306 RepID=A0AAW2EYM4_9HYME
MRERWISQANLIFVSRGIKGIHSASRRREATRAGRVATRGLNVEEPYTCISRESASRSLGNADLMQIVRAMRELNPKDSVILFTSRSRLALLAFRDNLDNNVRDYRCTFH